MTLKGDEEFYISLAIIGGLALAGLLIIIGLTFVGIAVYNKVTKQKVIKELYEKKDRQNGQKKGGSKGSW